MDKTLTHPATRLRAAPARGTKTSEPVVRDGGDRKAGLIRQASVITRGEALGHRMWIDETFLEQNAAAINASADGIKARFTHPSLSGDGLGSMLGRVKNAALDGDRVRADLHFAESAHDTPDGDLAAYTMDLAEQDPELFGISIVFDHHVGQEEEFTGKNSDKDGKFRSPDKENKNNYRHARLAKLYGADVVDEPAANPDGLFHRRDGVAVEADAIAQYALGMSDELPAATAFSVHPERLRGFVTRFCEAHGLQIVTKDKNSQQERTEGTEGAAQPPALSALPPVQNGEQIMPKDNEPVATGFTQGQVDAARAEGLKAGVESERVRFRALKAAFDDGPFVAEQFEAGCDVTTAMGAWTNRRLAKLEEENKTLQAELAAKQSSGRRGAEPVNHGGAAAGGSGGGESFRSLAQKRADEKKISLHQAMSELAREKPELYEKEMSGR